VIHRVADVAVCLEDGKVEKVIDFAVRQIEVRYDD